MAKGMFIDTSLCTGCKACQVACKQWNGLDADPARFRQGPGMPYPVASGFTGDSYDNTGRMTARDWRRVLFIEQVERSSVRSRWLFMSDSCKHCSDAACLNVCPVQAIERTELGNVVVRQDKCVGTRHCNMVCPYGAVHYSEKTNTSHKCTLCNDRIHNGMGTACAKACPTGSIRFGEMAELKAAAEARLSQLAAQGDKQSSLYGLSQAGGLKVFYLLRDEPAVYGLPEKPVVPQRMPEGMRMSSLGSRFPLLLGGMAALAGLLDRRRSKVGIKEGDE